MSRIERFEDLIAWQKARVLARDAYLMTFQEPFERDFALTGQIRRSALSVPSNIAEGFERGGRREFHQFLSVAKGSCAELRTQICVANDIGYIDQETATRLLQLADEVGRIVGGLRRSVAAQIPRKRSQSSVLSPQSRAC